MTIQILLVEDEDPKRRHILEFLREVAPLAAVREARSVNTAIDALDNGLPDLILLDMSLPTFDMSALEGGGRPQGSGGLEIFRYMNMSDLNCPVIVITGYEAFSGGPQKQMSQLELSEHLTSTFPSVFYGLLYYNSAFDDWKNQLRKILVDFI